MDWAFCLCFKGENSTTLEVETIFAIIDLIEKKEFL
jgi:hypothetical protein